MIIAVIALAICFILIVSLVIDLFPIARDWLGRIHIGRFDSREAWRTAITHKGLHWLKRTPKIKVTDNTRLVVIDMMRGNYTRDAIQHWQEAALLLGLAEMKRAESDQGIDSIAAHYFSQKLNSNGGWIHTPKEVDSGILAYGIMKLAGDSVDRFKPALDQVWKLIESHVGEDGTVQYRKSMPDYRYVDTIGFICPFLIAYGVRYNQEACIQLAVDQLQHYERYGMLYPNYLPSHAYHLKDGTPAGLYGWGRGLGWYAIGLADAWSELPEEHPSKPVLEAMVKKFARTVLKYQQANGCWGWAVNRKESRPDSSATATLGWFLLQASRVSELKESCSKGAILAAGYLMKVTRKNGVVDFSQGDTKDIGVYSMLFNQLPFTQGFSIRMAYNQSS